ncbi:hypothetical protein [Scytonema millei]|uniref:Uncharacterized protein n=1 Tax=Scytonema millei VB511283 TaxID=1245923 RepID=A0A9X5E4T7_9CYAN|nr:hypothetical protein [Scytonema millei]NHC35199.1 hypothetical protein [Scytonema millei VB511283]
MRGYPPLSKLSVRVLTKNLELWLSIYLRAPARTVIGIERAWCVEMSENFSDYLWNLLMLYVAIYAVLIYQV